MSSFVVVAVDLSPCAAGVMEEGIRQAQEGGHQLLLLHVLSLPVPAQTVVDDGTGRKDAALQVLMRDVQEHLMPLLAQVEAAGVRGSVRVLVGDPAPRIVAEAHRVGAVGLVVGSHGRTGLARVVHGSVSEAVRAAARMPVTMVPTVHRDVCEAASCGWCDAHVTPVARRIAAEAEG